MQEWDITRPFQTLDQQYIGAYQLLSELGRGGMGAVYKVRSNTGQIFALKIILDKESFQPDSQKRFLREIQILAKVEHPNIIKIYDVGEWQGRLFYVMSYLDGITLSKHLDNKRKLPEKEAVDIMLKITLAIDTIHKAGCIHRDIKPENIMLADGKPYLMDFGIASSITEDTRITKTGAAVGTPNYMPPEQAKGQWRKMGPWTDVYQIGATLYHLVTGVLPFHGRTALDVMLNLATKKLTPPRNYSPQLSKEIEAVIQKTMEKEPEKRYASAADLAIELESLLQERKTIAVQRRIGRSRRDSGRKRANAFPMYLITIASLLLMSAIFIYVQYFQQNRKLTTSKPVATSDNGSKINQGNNTAEQNKNKKPTNSILENPALEKMTEAEMHETVRKLEEEWNKIKKDKDEKAFEPCGIRLLQINYALHDLRTAWSIASNLADGYLNFTNHDVYKYQEYLACKSRIGIEYLETLTENKDAINAHTVFLTLSNDNKNFLNNKDFVQKRLKATKILDIPVDTLYCLYTMAKLSPDTPQFREEAEVLEKRMHDGSNLTFVRAQMRRLLHGVGYAYISNWDMDDPIVKRKLDNSFEICEKSFPEILPFMRCIKALLLLKKNEILQARQEVFTLSPVPPKNIHYPGLSVFVGEWLWPEMILVQALVFLQEKEYTMAQKLFFTFEQRVQNYKTKDIIEPYLAQCAWYKQATFPKNPAWFQKNLRHHLAHIIATFLMRAMINNEVLLKNNKVENAQETLEDLQSFGVKDYRHMIHYKLGMRLFEKQQFVAAESHFEKALVLSPGFHELVFMLGEVYMRTGRCQKARECFEHCVKNPPTWSPEMAEESKKYLERLKKE